MKRVLFIVLALWFFTFWVQGQTVEFTRENVTFNLDSSHFLVTSDLYFENDHDQPLSQAIFFPYSCEGHVVKVDTVIIMDVSKNSIIKPARKSLAGVMFQVSFAPKEQKKFRIIYSQDHDGHLVGYVVTKVKYWKGSLPQASYTLNVNSPAIVIDSTAFKPGKITEEGGKTIYSWYKTNFKPEKEFCIYFHLK
jgi:hypothetical protein